MTYSSTKFEVATSNGLGGDTFTRKYIIWPWPSGQGHTRCCPVPSKSCDLCTYRVWSYYIKIFRRRSIYKKIQYLTFELDLGVKVARNVAHYPLHHVTYPATKFEVATSKGLGGDTFTRKYIIWPLTLTVNVTRNVAQYPLHHVTYSTTKFEVATSNGLGGDTFTRNVTDGRTHAHTHGRTDRRTTDRLWHERKIPFFSTEKSGYNQTPLEDINSII